MNDLLISGDGRAGREGKNGDQSLFSNGGYGVNGIYPSALFKWLTREGCTEVTQLSQRAEMMLLLSMFPYPDLRRCLRKTTPLVTWLSLSTNIPIAVKIQSLLPRRQSINVMHSHGWGLFPSPLVEGMAETAVLEVRDKMVGLEWAAATRRAIAEAPMDR